MIELANIKTVQQRLREHLAKARKLLAMAKKRVGPGPGAFEAYAGDVIEYNERIRTLEEVYKASCARGSSPDSIFAFVFQRLIAGCSGNVPHTPTNKAWALVAELLKKNSPYA